MCTKRDFVAGEAVVLRAEDQGGRLGHGGFEDAGRPVTWRFGVFAVKPGARGDACDEGAIRNGLR